MFTRVHLHYNPVTMQVKRYPWHLLDNVGDEVIFYGKDVQPYGIQFQALRYFNRHGKKVRTRITGDRVIHIVRTK